jgi:DNA-binding beta-propeller fold protein YncE
MKFKYYLLILLFSGLEALYPQSFIPIGEIGAFNHAKSFSINSAGFLFVTDIATNEVIKLDTLGNVIKSIGGYGWTESLFDFPVDVFATTLNVYISDKNNNRIQFFDKDLNFLSDFTRQNSIDDRLIFRYPLCSVVSSQGDLFILDSDNNRILKFNLRGEFQTSIGSFDAGQFSLNSPQHFIITSSAKIIVADSPNLVVFDQFGNGIKKILFAISPENINIFYQTICVNNKKQIAIFNEAKVESGIIEPIMFTPNIEEEIIDAVVSNSRLYVLVKNKILIYKIMPS